MYAAAGGASLASRQARQRQRQQKKTQQLQAKLHPPKAIVVAEHGASTPTRSTSRQFHQLPTNYLRAPQAHGRKLSASYTGQSKLQLLPIDEGDTQSVMHMRMHSHAHMHPGAAVVQYPNAHHQSHHPYVPIPHGRVSPKLMHRHSGSSGTTFHHSHLPKSATATLPLVSQVEATPPTTPSAAAVGVKASAAAEDAAQSRIQIQIPHDNIIVTPATPMASPGHVVKQLQADDLPEAAAETQPLTASYDDDEPMQPPTGPLERKCSVYRMRRSDAFEQDAGSAAEVGAASDVTSPVGGIGFLAKKQLKELTFQQQYEPLILDEPTMMFKGLANGRKWQPCAYCEEGICVCEHIECAQGRAAWLERGRRCSVQESQAAMAAASHRRWVKRNRIQDASLGGSSDDEDFLGVLRGPSTFANAFLYVGLGTIALGLVIAFVGTGEKGFKTVELRLIGPSLIGMGLICCILRILFCICPSHCISSSKKARKKNGNKVDADHTTSLLRGENKRVSIARGPSMQRYPITHKRSNSKMLNEGMEALRQIATTSLFMQNEQKPSSNRVVPIIKEPDNPADAPLEMKKLETALNVCEISDDEDDVQVGRTRKTIRISEESNTTAAINTKSITSPTSANPNTHSSSKTATTSKIVHEKPPLLRSSSKLSRQRIALNQQQQQQQQQQQPQQDQEQQSQSLSSSSTVKDSIDGDQFLMETSLMIINPTPATSISEARPPAPSTSSSGAKPRLTRTPLTVTSIPPPPAPAATNTGAISRVSSAPLSYDLPSSTPHTYATATTMSSSRSAASALLSSIAPERETRVRGPLGMPLSALTATGSRYSSPSSSASAATATTTTISLLPLPAPPTIATAATVSGAAAAAASAEATSTSTTLTISNAPCIPGQVMPAAESSTAQSILLPTKTTATPNQSPQQLLQPSLGGLAKTLASPPHISSLANSNIFKFPAPLSSSSNSSSAASSNGRTAGANVGTSTLAPPATMPVSKFEPELVLSPAKLGQ